MTTTIASNQLTVMEDTDAPTFYVDGYTGVYEAGGVVKLHLYEVRHDSDGQPYAQIVTRVVIATEYFTKVIDSLAQFKDTLEQAPEEALEPENLVN